MIAHTHEPSEPTDTKRGSPERADVYGARYEAGLSIWNEKDSLETITVDEMDEHNMHAASRLNKRTAQATFTLWVFQFLVSACNELGVDLNTTPPDDRQEFAEWLRERRESLGLSQGDFSLASGFTQSDVSKWERRERIPTRRTIERLADALNAATR